MCIHSALPFRSVQIALSLVVTSVLVAGSGERAKGQGFQLAPPSTAGRNNTRGFTQNNPSNLFSGLQRNGGRAAPNSPGFNNTPGFNNNNNGMNIATGVLGLIGGAMNAANQANANQFGGGMRTRSPMMVPNSSGRNNFNGFTSNQTFRSVPARNSTSSSNSNRFNSSSWRSGYTTYYPESSSRTYRTSYPRTSTTQYSSRPAEIVYPQSRSTSTVRVVAQSSPAPYVANMPPSIDALKDSMPITLRCPEEENGIFTYQLINRLSGKTYDYTMTPGQKQELKGGSKWKIRFDQGQGKGTLTYDLSGGETYQTRKNGQHLWGVYAE